MPTCLIFSHFIFSYFFIRRPKHVRLLFPFFLPRPAPSAQFFRRTQLPGRGALNRICRMQTTHISWPRKTLSSSHRFIDNAWWELRFLSSSSPFFRSHCLPETFRFPGNDFFFLPAPRYHFFGAFCAVARPRLFFISVKFVSFRSICGFAFFTHSSAGRRLREENEDGTKRKRNVNNKNRVSF